MVNVEIIDVLIINVELFLFMVLKFSLGKYVFKVAIKTPEHNFNAKSIYCFLSQNGQTHSNNLSAIADGLFECV